MEYGFGYIVIRSPYTPIVYLLKGDYICWVKNVYLALEEFKGLLEHAVGAQRTTNVMLRCIRRPMWLSSNDEPYKCPRTL